MNKKKSEKMVSNPTMGSPKLDLTPSATTSKKSLPELSNFTSFKSLEMLATSVDSLAIAFDSEWFYKADGLRCVTSWQFAVIWESEVYEFVFFRMCSRNISLEVCLATILRELGFKAHDVEPYKRYNAITQDETGAELEKTFTSYAKALENSVRLYNEGDIAQKGKFMKLLVDSGVWAAETPHSKRGVFSWTDYPDGCRLPITLVCHTGKVDVSTFDQSAKYDKELLKRCSEVQGGLVTLESIKINPLLLKVVKNSHEYRFPLSLTIADTMCHAPAGQKSLDSLGKVVGFGKVHIDAYYKSNMGEFFAEKPLEYVKYSATDSFLTLLYYSSLWGYNQSCRVTLSSAAAFAARELQMDYLDCASSQEYDKKYRGLVKVSKGMVKCSDGAGFIGASSLEAINNDANLVQLFCSNAYYGGYNACIDVGYYPVKTYDYDLSNAYPTAMCLVPDLDWDAPIKSFVRNEELSLSDFALSSGDINPVPLFVGDVTFEFPDHVKYPCITYSEDGVPVYLRKSDGLRAVYSCSVEIVLALQLGAKVFCKMGFWLNPLKKEDGSLSYSMRHAVKQMVTDRNIAKARHGKGSLEELLLKIFVKAIPHNCHFQISIKIVLQKAINSS